jgi:hypothetical protein
MDDRKVVTPTEARQATPQQTSYRVLTRSLMIAVVVGIALYAAFYAMSPA